MRIFTYLARKIVSAALIVSGCVIDTSGLSLEDRGMDVARMDAAVFYDGKIGDEKINDGKINDSYSSDNDKGYDGEVDFPDGNYADGKLIADAWLDSVQPDAAVPFDANVYSPDAGISVPDGNMLLSDAPALDTLLLPADALLSDGSPLSPDATQLSADASPNVAITDAAVADAATSNNNLTPFQQNLSLLEAKLQTLRWISYAPTNFNPVIGQYPSSASIEEDLQVLYQHGFRGLITYGSENSLQYVPALAKLVGFEGVIMGIWLPQNWQLQNAEAEQQSVEGYCVGNENLGVSYSLEELAQAMAQLRTNTNKPVTTTEQWADYFGGPAGQAEQLMAISDFIFPNVHPYWAGITDPAEAAQWTADRYQDFIINVPPEKIILFKEVGLPSAGCPQCNEQNQSTYYQLLAQLFAESLMLSSYFEAFDQPWKNWAAVEPHWGLFTAGRAPKAVIAALEQ